MDNEILLFWVEVVESMKGFAKTFIAVLSVCSIFLTCVGKSLSELCLYLLDNNHRKGCKYSIIKSQRDTKFVLDVGEYSICFIKEMIKILEIPMAAYVILQFVLWTGNRLEYVYILFCISILSLSMLIRKKIDKEKVLSVLFKMILLVIGNCIGICVLIKFLSGYVYILSGISIFNFILMKADFCYSRRRHTLKTLKVLELLKSLEGIIYIIYFFMQTMNGYAKNNVDFFLFCGWSIVCLVKCIILVNMNDAPKIEFQIHMKEGIKKTTKTIYQYQCNKVKYSLDDNEVEIINIDEIIFIDYIRKTIRTKRKKVTCLLENDEKIDFEGYKCIKEPWISFYTIEDMKKHITIMNMNNIKKITVENR